MPERQLPEGIHVDRSAFAHFIPRLASSRFQVEIINSA